VNEFLIKIEHLSKHFIKMEGFINRRKMTIRAVNNIDLEVRKGEILALVGESGSGKTTLGKVIIKIYEPSAGKIWFDNIEISQFRGNRLRTFRKSMQMVFQDPTSSLNPRQTIYEILSLPLKVHRNMSRSDRAKRAKELLDWVDLPEMVLHRYPHALSGGQKQRINVARALASNPRLIVLDEPTSALDVSVQAKIITLIKGLKQKFDLTYIYISHDLAVVKNIADRIAIMYMGEIQEILSSEDLLEKSRHPYTKALLSAIPTVSDEETRLIPEEITLEGEIPSPYDRLSGCSFSSRCREMKQICCQKPPSLIKIGDNHYVRCFLANG
jgi:oligopeptide/dipeptide ABC transporter ATP-binding protein